MKPIVIQSMYNQFRHSIMQNLTKAILEICDNEFLWVNHKGRSMTREELVSDVANGFINYEKWNSNNQNVRFFDECAVLNGFETIVNAGDGEKPPLQTFVTVVFIKRDAGWKLISGQSTAIMKSII